MIELKNIGERLTSIVSVEHYALGLLKMLDTHTQKELANYLGVSPAKLSPIIQLLSDMYIYKPCVIVRYVVSNNNTYHLLLDNMSMNSCDLISIFRLNNDSYYKLLDDLDAQFDMLSNTYKIAKIPQITIDALQNIEYKYKA